MQLTKGSLSTKIGKNAQLTSNCRNDNKNDYKITFNTHETDNFQA